jgi:signal transduction histidine kinase
MARLERATTNLSRALVGGGIVAVASTILLLLLFVRSIGRKLAVLTDNAKRLAAGEDLAAPLDGADELATLDRVFHSMAEALAAKDRENEMFVYSVSHDLRSPLVNLQGFSQELALVAGDLRGLLTAPEIPPTVRQQARSLVDRDMGESIHFIQTAVSRLAGIIDALLRLSRVGRVEYHWQTVDVRAVVTRVLVAANQTLRARQVEVEVQDLPPAWGDPQALEQVFANLIGNAVNYLDPSRPGRIQVGSRSGPGDLRTWTIQDNGLGIPEQHQAKVFVAFQRLHPEAAPGEGIGLAVVRRVVERHGGRIWLESTPGVGSTFFVALPTPPIEGH